ncbi:MAG: L-histidine N(alpha)-methyltransferase [Vicinamibacterales bacterium]
MPPAALAARHVAAERLSPIAKDVARGLLRHGQKTLPAYLFYDEAGSRLYEAITTLPEYYPTRTERAILTEHADDIVALAAAGTDDALTVVELGAGTASKTQVLLDAVVRRQGRCLYVPTDVSATAIAEAATRLRREAPRVEVRPLCAMHTDVFRHLERIPPRQFVLFVGSSIGNFDDLDAQALLRGLRRGLRPGAMFLLGTDLRKSPALLIPAYDDAQGVTAAFNRNVLTRINRELDADFEPAAFRHRAIWNERASRIEMHLESVADQLVRIGGLGVRVRFRRGESVHTESSVKYDLPRVDALLTVTGFERLRTFTDARGWFAVHVAVAV